MDNISTYSVMCILLVAEQCCHVLKCPSGVERDCHIILFKTAGKISTAVTHLIFNRDLKILLSVGKKAPF
jgi:hypothetical protein